MASLEDLNFDANNFEEMADFSPIPEGEYDVIAIDSGWKATQSGGEMLSFQWEIISEDQKGRYLWSNLNLKNKNPQAVEIAFRELTSISKACGVMTPKDSSELHNKPLRVRVKNEEYNGKTYARVKAYKASTASVPVPAATPAAANGGNSMPWAR